MYYELCYLCPVKIYHLFLIDLLLSPPSLSFRPVEDGSTPPARGVLSMQGLSHGVIRVDSEEKLSVLTLQDVGSVMPGGEI